MSRNSIGESSTTLHLIVRPQMGVSVEPDLLVADFGSQAEFTCKIYAQDDRPTPSKSCQSSHTVWKKYKKSHFTILRAKRALFTFILWVNNSLKCPTFFMEKLAVKYFFRQKLMKNASQANFGKWKMRLFWVVFKHWWWVEVLLAKCQRDH